MVYPHKRLDTAVIEDRVVPGLLATLEKIKRLNADPVLHAGQEVEADRVFDGWFVPREYKGHLLHVEQHDDQSYTIHIYGNDGSPARRTMKFSEVTAAHDEACRIIDGGGGR